MMYKLSIVMPCYNCESTLEEAVSSVFTQSLTIPFEIVIVDDGSADNTKNLILELAKKHKEINFFFHDKNKGGGAARNTGIKNSSGDLIFCLDSDNFFSPNTLQRMISYLNEKKCDGVVIEERRFFYGQNHKKYNPHFNKITDRFLTLDDLFNIKDGGILLDNFLFTKQSYLEVGGYPEHHGFDTQCFEFKYLSANRKAFVCPGAIFYHRLSKDSYFHRVYKQEGFSINIYLIFEDVFYLFSRNLRKKIIDFDIFKKGKLGEENLKQFVDEEFHSNRDNFYINNKRKYLVQNGFTQFYEDYKDSNKFEDQFTLGIYLYKQGKYMEALEKYLELARNGIISKIIYYNILRCFMAMTGKYPDIEIESRVLKLIVDLNPQQQTISSVPNILLKVFDIYKKFKKHL